MAKLKKRNPSATCVFGKTNFFFGGAEMVWMGLHKSTLTATVANSLVEPQDAGAKSRGLLFPSTLDRKLLIRHQQDAQAPSLPPVKVDVVL